MRKSVIPCLLLGLSLLAPACGGDDGDDDTGSGGRADSCPTAEPASPSSCSSVGLFCEYPARQCFCGTDESWLCDDVHPSCPAKPAPDADCPEDGVRCVYDTGAICFCSSGAWNCPRN